MFFSKKQNPITRKEPLNEEDYIEEGTRQVEKGRGCKSNHEGRFADIGGDDPEADSIGFDPYAGGIEEKGKRATGCSI